MATKKAEVSKASGEENGEELDVFGDIPQARFGHTVTLVSSSKAVLFGGATGDTGKYIMTGDTYLFNILSKTWAKLTVKGVPPSPRAAHHATNVEQMQMVVYGGATGGGSLASDDLFLLDMRNGEEEATWMIVPVVGSTPGRRYGHTIVFAKPHLLVFGGNTGSEPVNDVWCLSVEKAPFSWTKLNCGTNVPPVRVYHSAALCSTGSATGMMVIFGGRTSDSSALNDTWGLRRHRDGRWDWVPAPYKTNSEIPTYRYQHSTLFLGPLMIVIGGRTNTVGEVVPLEVYDTESSEWTAFHSLQRFRHVWWAVGFTMYIHGGFEQDTPNIPINVISTIDGEKLFVDSEILYGKMKNAEKKDSKTKDKGKGGYKNQTPYKYKGGTGEKEFKLAHTAHIAHCYSKEVAPHAPETDFSKLVRQISIDKLEEEAKKIGPPIPGSASQIVKNPKEALCTMFINDLIRPKEWQEYPIQDEFRFKETHIHELIDEWKMIVNSQPIVLKVKPPCKVFGNLHGQYIDLMRFFDVWKFPGEDAQGGDVSANDYIFLGNYVDRGSNSLEVICLLMALKVKYPDQIHLLRGAHEDKIINYEWGLADECRARLGEDPDDKDSVFQKLNDFFEYLPLAASIKSKIFCIHGGIGSRVNRINEIEALKRPIEIPEEVTTQEQQIVIDCLWSEPTDSDTEMGVVTNSERAAGGKRNLVKFGPDRVDKFLKTNYHFMILRSHDIVSGGYSKFADGNCITINSWTDFIGSYNNDAGFFVVQKKLEITPKIIRPLKTTEKRWQDEQKGEIAPLKDKSSD